MKKTFYAITIIFWSCLFLNIARPTECAPSGETIRKNIPGLKIAQPPTINGVLDDACWQNVPQATGFTDERTEKQAKNQSVGWLVYTDKAIYVGLHLYEDMPEKIVARQTKDQTQFQGEDWVSFSLDPFHTHQHSDRNFFMVNPLGTKFAHLATGRAEKSEWIGIWEAAAQIVEDGWIVEMAIPWQMLDYPDTTEPIRMGINIDRGQQRTGEHSWWCNLGVQQFIENDGHWVGVLPPPRQRDLKLLPYLMGGVRNTATNKITSILRAGANVRYEITPQLRIIGTVNPDFENIENAVEGIDFSYGERYVPDRRPFFLEDRNIYNPGNLFHSRRIVDMDGGIKLFGKIGKNTTIGTLGTYHQNNQNLLLRASQSLTATSTVSAAFLSHHKRGNSSNNIGHLSGRVRQGKFSVRSDISQSWEGESQGTKGYFGLGYRHKLVDSYSGFYWVAPNFVNHLGYQPFTGYRGGNLGGTLVNEWRDGIVRKMLLFVHGETTYTYNGDVFRRNLTLYSRLLTHSDYSLAFRWKGGHFKQFTDHLFSIDFGARASDRFNTFSVNYDWGKLSGEVFHLISGTLKLHAYDFTAGLTSQIQWHFERRYQQILTLTYDFSPALSLGSRLIWQVEGINIYFALRRSGYAGTDFFIILGDPNAIEFKKRAVAKVLRSF